MITNRSTQIAVIFSLAPALPLQQQEPLPVRIFNGLAGLVLLILIVLCLIAFVLTLTGLLPNVTQRNRHALQRSPWRVFFVGLANYLFLGGIALALFSTQIQILGFFGLLIVAFLTIITALGLPGLISLLGEQLAMLHGGQLSPLKQVIWGTVIVTFAGLLPFVGWFLLTPILLMICFGAAVLGWRNRQQVERHQYLNNETLAQ